MAAIDFFGKRRSRSMGVVALTIALVGGAVATVNLAFASTSTNSTIYACKNPAGALRLVLNATSCRAQETLVQWNVLGPTGPTGATGKQGLQGPAGPAGTSTLTPVPHSTVVGTLTFTPPTTSKPMTVNLYSFDMPMANVLSLGSQSSGAGAGKVTFAPATFTLPVGPASLDLTDFNMTGSRLTNATVDLFAPDAKTTQITIDLKIVIVKSVDLVNDGAATSTLQDQIQIEYGAVQYTLPSTNPSTPLTASWNQLTNTPNF